MTTTAIEAELQRVEHAGAVFFVLMRKDGVLYDVPKDVLEKGLLFKVTEWVLENEIRLDDKAVRTIMVAWNRLPRDRGFPSQVQVDV